MSKVIVDTLENTAGTFTSGIDSLGPSTAYGGVGSYIIGVRIQAQIASGVTAAGSSIVNATLYDQYVNVFGYQDGLGGNRTWKGSYSMSGTWRQMFGADIGNNNVNAKGGLWVRIS